MSHDLSPAIIGQLHTLLESGDLTPAETSRIHQIEAQSQPAEAWGERRIADLGPELEAADPEAYQLQLWNPASTAPSGHYIYINFRDLTLLDPNHHGDTGPEAIVFHTREDLEAHARFLAEQCYRSLSQFTLRPYKPPTDTPGTTPTYFFDASSVSTDDF